MSESNKNARAKRTVESYVTWIDLENCNKSALGRYLILVNYILKHMIAVRVVAQPECSGNYASLVLGSNPDPKRVIFCWCQTSGRHFFTPANIR